MSSSERQEFAHLKALPFAAKRLWRSGALGDLIRRWASEEEGRFILFAPCLMVAGSALWLHLSEPPALAVVAILAVSCAGLWGAAVRRHAMRAVHGARIAACFFLGMALIALRTEMVDAPVVPDGLGPVTVTGVLEEVELRERDRRYTVRVDRISRLGPEATPHRIRVVWRGEPGSATPGDLVRLRASLSPPPGPAMPGGYDFGRAMFYERIGGSGFTYAPPAVIEHGGTGFSASVERLRDRIADRIEEVVGGPQGAVTAALVTGKRERIPEDVVEDLRDAGLAHLLAISGLHMGLVCGFLFFAIRWVLSRFEVLALRFPIKKWAALGALSGGAFYLLLSGGAWSAQRAFIMAGIVFLAILFDRRGISLRNAALAAIVIVVLRPEAVISAGFQMSFAAVVALIASFSYIEERLPRSDDHSPLMKALRFTGGLAMTSLVAGLATAPFALFHFGRFASFGLLANMLAMPIITLGVMPAAVLALFVMPLGLDGLVLALVGRGVEMVIGIASWTANLPGAVQLVGSVPTQSFLCAVVGLFTLAIFRAPWRLVGACLMALALPLSAGEQPPDVFLSRDLRNVGVRLEGDGPALALLSKRRDRFTAEVWLRSIAEEPDVTAQATLAACSEGVCYQPLLSGDDIAVLDGETGIDEACARAEIVILRTHGTSGQPCRALLIALDENGRSPAATLSQRSGEWVAETARR
ncbi:MAG: ComEC/Rec2 family competence protein [Pseudomonadota bacterium]